MRGSHYVYHIQRQDCAYPGPSEYLTLSSDSEGAARREAKRKAREMSWKDYNIIAVDKASYTLRPILK